MHVSDLCKRCGGYAPLRHFTEQYGMVCQECYLGHYAQPVPKSDVKLLDTDGNTVGQVQFLMEHCTQCGDQTIGSYHHGDDRLCTECHWEREGGKPEAESMTVSWFREHILGSGNVSYTRYTDSIDGEPHPGDEVWLGENQRFILIEG